MSAPGVVRAGWVAPPALPTLVALGAACLVWAALFRPEITAAVGVWYDSTAYSHCFLVLPTAVFLAWERRAALAGTPLRPAPSAAALAAVPVALGWFAAERLGIMEVRQFAALALLLLTVFAAIGWQASRVMAAPLLYLVFLVPFGAFVTPVLQQITLELTMLFLGACNIPAVSDGFIIEVPHATFFVAEACAGLRFLIASVAFGTLYACLIYRSAGHRIAFIAASVVIPVVANGIRAFGIVALGYLLGSAEAAAADHLIYGWLFFSVVILLLILAGLPFRQDGAAYPARPGSGAATATVKRPWGPAFLVLLLGAAGPAAATVLDRTAMARFSPEPSILPVEGCSAVPAPAAEPASTRTLLDCGADGRLTLVVTVFPPRTTASPIQGALRRVSGEMAAEDVQVSSLAVPGGEPDRWTLVKTSEPTQVTAETVWRDGRPAGGGLSGRIAQARDSLMGSRHAPVVVALSWNGPGEPVPPAGLDEATRRIASVVARQTGWPAAIVHISEAAAR